MKSLLRNSFLALLLVAVPAAIAQESASTPQQQQQQEQPTTSPAKPAGAPISPGPAENPILNAQQQLAHTANAAAGEEENGHNEFKQSASVKWFAAHTGLDLGTAYWVLICINFAIIAGFIAWGWKKNVPGMFRSRTENIRKNLDEARRASEDANRRLADIESRLAKLDAEIAEMHKSSQAEAAAEEERIRAAAEEDRRKVIASAEQEIEAAAKAARRELKSYAASLAVSIAEKNIQVDTRTDQSLVRTFVRELSQNGSNGGR